MTAIRRWEPFREARRVHDLLDRIMGDSLLGPSWVGDEMAGNVPLDVFQTENEIVVKATIPGIKPEDIHVSITGDTLSIRGEVREEHETKEIQYHVRERRYGGFSRSLTLPSVVVADKALAEFENGVLTLTLPKAEEVKAKTIAVKVKK